MNTNFIHDTVSFEGMKFTFDGNSKITASNGTFEKPKPNAFSTVQISDCPGSTPTCRKTCYVHGLQKFAPDLHRTYQHNSVNMRSVLLSKLDTERVSILFSDWIKENCKEFRWHVSGDVFSKEYAAFINLVCWNSPDVTHWIYTRTFDFVPDLLEPRHNNNLVVNISADKDNYPEAQICADKYNLRLCYFSDKGELPRQLDYNSVIFPNYSLRGRDIAEPKKHPWYQSLTDSEKQMLCPVDFLGQSEFRRCGKCKKCLTPLLNKN